MDDKKTTDTDGQKTLSKKKMKETKGGGIAVGNPGRQTLKFTGENDADPVSRLRSR